MFFLIGVNPGGLGGRGPQILGRGVVKYYILSCTESIFESGDF